MSRKDPLDPDPIRGCRNDGDDQYPGGPSHNVCRSTVSNLEGTEDFGDYSVEFNGLEVPVSFGVSW